MKKCGFHNQTKASRYTQLCLKMDLVKEKNPNSPWPLFLIKQVSLTYLKTLSLKIAKLKVAGSDMWAPFLTALGTVYLYLLHASISVTSKTVVSHETTAEWSNLSIFCFHCFWNSALISVQMSPLKSCVWQNIHHFTTHQWRSFAKLLVPEWKSCLHCMEFWGAMHESRPRTVCFKLCMFC